MPTRQASQAAAALSARSWHHGNRKNGRHSSMLKIYDYKGFPNPARVRIALAEKGLAEKVEFISIDVSRRRTQTSGVRKEESVRDSACARTRGWYMHQRMHGYHRVYRQSGGRAGANRENRQGSRRDPHDAAADRGQARSMPLRHTSIMRRQDWGRRSRSTRTVNGARKSRASDRRHAVSRPGAGQTAFSGRRPIARVADITAFAGVLFAAIAKIEVPRELGNLISWHERVAGRPSIAYA